MVLFRAKGVRTVLAAVVLVLCAGPAPAGDAKDLPEALRSLRQGQSPADLDDEALDQLLKIHQTAEEQVRMVLLPVSVTTRRGRIVRGLDRDDFRVYEDTVPQKIGYFAKENDQPVIVAFLLDVSGSMRQMGKLETAKKTIRTFVRSLGPEDRFALICFADEQVSWITDFTSDRDLFLKRLDVQEAFGRTAVNDAVAATPRLVDERIHGKKAIVMFSDGIDNASTVSPWKATRLARQVNVPIYVIGYSAIPRSALQKGSTASNLKILGAFARETGGLLFPVHEQADMRNAAMAVVEELRFQYIIGYYPVRKNWDGRFRRVKLETRRDSLEVRTRNGYYAIP